MLFFMWLLLLSSRRCVAFSPLVATAKRHVGTGSSLAFRSLSSSPDATNPADSLIKAPYQPSGDQPEAIERIVQHFSDNPTNSCAILRGITGTGKTCVMAHTIARLQKPTLVLCHNKTLAAQLARELRAFLGSAELFVSFYNNYTPESYKEATDTYVAKKSSINADIDALRHRATRALLTPSNGKPVVVVASVSCLYGLGLPSDYMDASLEVRVNEQLSLEEQDFATALSRRLMYAQVETEDEFTPGTFQHIQWENPSDNTRTDQVLLWAPHERFPWRITSRDNRILSLEVGHGKGFDTVSELCIFPAKHHVMAPDRQEQAIRTIEEELKDRVKELTAEKKHAEAQRLQQRVYNDLGMIRETGFCSGIENYSRHLTGREAGEPPGTLLDYIPSEKWMLMVDESHVTLPQLKAMYGGDQARKRMLVKHGYRLPSALDNRPLQASEFWDKIKGNTLFVSATPGPEELQRAEEEEAPMVDMIIRPTYVCDPLIEVRPPETQLEDLHHEIRTRAEKGERSLVITLSKRDAEDLSSYMNENGIPSTYIHSGLKTNARSQALQSLQTGEVDCLVGVNCLREGLDLPQVSLVAVLQADVEGFLRSETALLQIVGRAARHRHGQAIFYARRITDAMKACMESTAERRRKQLEYNEKNNCEVRSTKGSSVKSIFDLLKDQIEEERAFDLAVGKANPSRNGGMATNGEIEGAVTLTIPSKGREKIDTDHIPSSPGVYFWKDEKGKVLYIGKAVKLRSRVKSYISKSTKHSHRIRTMIDKARSVDFVLAPSERDALVLESNLIKHHQPPFNVLLKDDEHYPYICASVGDSLPRFSIVARPPATAGAQAGGVISRHRYFGPYTSFREINAILDSIESIYDLRAKSFLVRHGSASVEEYKETFNQALAHVLGKKKERDQIDIQKARAEYEEAGLLFDSPRNVCRDVVTLVEPENENENALVHVVQLRQGILAGQFSYECKIPSGITTDEDRAVTIQTVLERKHYPSGREASAEGISFFPDKILLSHEVTDTQQLRAVIRQARSQIEPKRKTMIEISTASTRGSTREADARALDFCQKNALQVASQKRMENQRGSAVSSLDGRGAEELASLLSLKEPLKRIECYDISHTQGDSAVGSRVVFIDGKPAPHLYRKFNIQTVKGADDYASIQEVLERRFKRSWINGQGGQVDAKDPWSIPDLVVIDGGQGQLNAAIQGMSNAMIYPSEPSSDTSVPRSAVVPICSLAKNKEEVFVPGSSTPVNEAPDSPALLLLRALRDESHRFALTAHRRRRSLTK